MVTGSAHSDCFDVNSSERHSGPSRPIFTVVALASKSLRSSTVYILTISVELLCILLHHQTKFQLSKFWNLRLQHWAINTEHSFRSKLPASVINRSTNLGSAFQKTPRHHRSLRTCVSNQDKSSDHAATSSGKRNTNTTKDQHGWRS